ncbi:winged helix-turn-helix domain-containing protein [Pendulispora rubella]|uniref:Winged helix-turn-helix domain-containing protein n=1 Tax=Pendulispora rubella TaxID=2741070 RepID=A0ABZ2LF07_9BACT
MPHELVLLASRFDVANFGELVSDPSRVIMLLSLMDDRARPATELAQLAGITPQTASFHLQRLVDGGLLRVEPLGRHRYFRLAGEEVAEAIEAISLLNPPKPARVPQSPARLELTQARMCYHHLAGRLGVAWLAGIEQARFLRVRDGAFALTKRGIAWFEESGLSAPRWRTVTGKFCLDWTERRHHLGGSLGALLTRHLFTMEWIARRGGGANAPVSRAVRVTSKGRREFARQLALPNDVLSN